MLMRTFVASGISVLLFAGCGGQSTIGPRLVAPGLVDLGAIESAEQAVEAKVSLANVGDAALQIHSVATSCQCTVAERVPAVLDPGMKAELVIRVKPSSGADTSVVRIESNDPHQRVTELTLRWQVSGHLYADPPRVDFGALRPGESAEKVVVLRGTSERCAPDAPFVSPKELSVADVTTTQLTIRVSAGHEVGARSGSVRIPFAHCSRLPVRIPVDWSVHDLVEAAPTRLFLGTALPGQTLRKPLVIRTTAARLRFSDVRLLGLEGASAKADDGTGASRVVTVDWTAPDHTGAFTGSIVVECEEPPGVQIEVPVSALVREAP